MPPLRERKDKLQLIQKIGQLEAGPSVELTWDPEALKILENFSWPGNIRQLRNVLRTATALCDDGRVTMRDLPEEICSAIQEEAMDEESENSFNALAIAERDVLLNELEEMHWNVSRVAKKLSLSRNTLYRRMKLYGINPPR
jgi:sigma-54 dependent transcriptional regulator, acetoin dehydrogenase operon transcriptional activator AcoR